MKSIGLEKGKTDSNHCRQHSVYQPIFHFVSTVCRDIAIDPYGFCCKCFNIFASMCWLG